MKKIAFLGSKEVGYSALNHLITHASTLDIELVAVLSNDRKLTESGNSILELANNYQIPILDSADELLELKSIDFIFSIQYHEILKERHIDCAKEIAINLHMAPLPEYRGCNQFSFAIIDNVKEFGTTLHVLESGIDSGDILFENRFPITENETVVTLHKKTTDASITLFENNIGSLINGNYSKTPQLSYKNVRSFGFHLRDEINHIKQIDLGWSDEKIDRYFRATYFPPFPPPFAIVDDLKIELSSNWKNELNR